MMLRPALLTFLLLASTLTACTSVWKRPKTAKPHTQQLVIDHATEGSQGPCVVHDDLWYQLSGLQLLVLDDQGRVISTTDLAPAGTFGDAVDMERLGDTMFVLLDDHQVVQVSIDVPMRPVVVGRIPASMIGLAPYGLSLLDGRVVAHGQGGVRTLDGGRVIQTDDELVSDVQEHGGRALYVVGRRIHRRADDQYLGSASIIVPGMLEGGPADAALLFARVEQSGSLIGVMGADCREVDARHWTRSVDGQVRELIPRGDKLLVVSGGAVHVFEATARGLVPIWMWEGYGIQSADWIDDDTVVVAGGFGRAIMDVVMPGQPRVITMMHEVPGGLAVAGSSGKALIGHSGTTAWQYELGQDPVQVDFESSLPTPRRSAAVLGWSIEIDDLGIAHLWTPGGIESLVAPQGGQYRCAAATEDAFWLGHDEGIVAIMLPRAGETEPKRLGVRLAGPVLCLEPLMLGGGVAYASGHGGFGVVREVR
ncbi:MAG: hypothetical protein MK077_02380 [Phycisphaerales bacterium]|nr:hypothetical protein [Phycisphaerales bacterium]